MRTIYRFFCLTVLLVLSSFLNVSAQSLLYEGSFTGTGTKALLGGGGVVPFPKVTVYAKIYTDKIEVSYNGKLVVKNFWKYDRGQYCYGDQSYCWMYSPESYFLGEATTEAVIPLARTCPVCYGGTLCATCRGAGRVVDPYSSVGTSLCGTCGASGLCWKCNGTGHL